MKNLLGAFLVTQFHLKNAQTAFLQLGMDEVFVFGDALKCIAFYCITKWSFVHLQIAIKSALQ